MHKNKGKQMTSATKNMIRKHFCVLYLVIYSTICVEFNASITIKFQFQLLHKSKKKAVRVKMKQAILIITLIRTGWQSMHRSIICLQ
jgi:hypothetical protein